jgi:hypothetical protein
MILGRLILYLPDQRREAKHYSASLGFMRLFKREEISFLKGGTNFMNFLQQIYVPA